MANIPNVNAPDEVSQEIILRPVKIAHQDGTVEQVYLQDTPEATGPKKISHKRFHLHLSEAYLLVGIVALGMGIYVTYRQLKKLNK